MFEVGPKNSLEVGLNRWYHGVGDFGGSWTFKMVGGGRLAPQTGG